MTKVEEKTKSRIDFQSLDGLADFIRKLKRAMLGQALDESKFQYFIDIEDPRERTILSEHDVYGHSLMQIAARNYEELKIWGEIAKEEDAYAHSKEGEGVRIGAAMAVGKRELSEHGQVTIQLPEVKTHQEEPVKGKEEKKK